MNQPWLFLDVNNLAHRAFHSLKDLSYGEVATGVTFGVLRDAVHLMNTHSTAKVVFCFDLGRPLRMSRCPDYKADRLEKRKTWTKQEKEAHGELQEQLTLLRTEVLEDLGFSNIKFCEGYEADDILGSLAKDLKEDEQAILVSSDKDLRQLLSKRVWIYNPHSRSMIFRSHFVKEWGLKPKFWAWIKAIAGGKDNIPGVPGIGEKFAASYLLGTLPDSRCAIIEKHRALWEANHEICKLPYWGTPHFKINPENDLSPKKWRKVLEKFGIFKLQGPF